MRDVPWWGVASAAAAPVLMVAGWTIAARLQPQPVDPVSETVSALAAVGAADRWVMTLTFVAANPEHPGTNFPVPHMICAAVGCAGVVGWPAGAWQRGPAAPWGLRPAVCAAAVAVLLTLAVWFGVELVSYGEQAGLAERIFGAAQALWPLTVVASCRYPVRLVVWSRRVGQTGR